MIQTMNVEKESSSGSNNSDVHNGPTSVWITQGGGDDASSISSPTRAMSSTAFTEQSNNTSRRTSSLTMWTQGSKVRISSSESDLQFSKRLSDVSDEGKLHQLKPAEFRESKRKSQRVLPISSLRFKSLGLIGRDEEKELLEERLRLVVAKDDKEGAPQGSRELVLISGNAGTGKTALANALRKSVKKLGGLYVKGKFDLYLRDEPYAGISAACREICGQILTLRETDPFDVIRSELIDKLGPERLSLLINIIPELSEIVGDEVLMDDVKSKKQGGEESKARFNYAFRIFVRVVSSHFAPLLILLDDIQWSDAATLDLLQVLIADRDNPGIMVIGIYRANEVTASHPLTGVIAELKRTADQDDFNLTEIEIGNMNASQVNEIIMCLLNTDDPKYTAGLADVCHKRSYGNVFSLLVFLEMLHAEHLLEYNLGTFKWTWDEQKILAQTAATSNVVDLMKLKIEKLPFSVGQRLSIAACLGFSFEPSILKIVWDTISRQRESIKRESFTSIETLSASLNAIDGDGEQDETEVWLAVVEREGFFEVEPDGTKYRWIHDKVQEAAISLVAEDELPGLKAHVGRILVSELDEKDLDPYIFTVVNLLHEGGTPDKESERIKLAELCLRASKKASNLSAFESAGNYAIIGVDVLPTNSWSKHYDLTLDLYSTAAEAACFLGHMEQLEKYYNEVVSQQNRPLTDRLRVYHAMISYKAGALGKPQEAMDLVLDILEQLGIKFPKGKASRLASTLLGVMKAKRKIMSLNAEDITRMPTMNDPTLLEKMRLLDQLFLAAYLAESDIMPLAIFASTRLTLENGLSEYTAPTFAALALIFGAALGDMKLAAKTGSLARVAITNVECHNLDARAELFLGGFVFCWTDPITRMSPRLLKAYEMGLSVGDNENACWSIAQYIVIGFQSGKPLATVKADCQIYKDQMLEFKRETVHADICIYLEMIRNLMGYTDGDPTEIEGEERFLSHSDHTVLGVFYSCQCILYLYFGEYEKAAKLALERGDTYAKGVPSHVWIMMETYTRGMALYVMARISGKRVYAKHAKKVHKTIKSWIKKGNPNVKHYDLLMNAESCALRGKLDEAEGWYQSAIVSATRRGSVHESAYASERYGDFLLNDRKDPEEARHKFDDAIRRYREWGAGRKANMLRQKHEELWQKPTEVVVQSANRRR